MLTLLELIALITLQANSHSAVYILYLLIIVDQVCRRNQTSVDNVWEATLIGTLRSDNGDVHENLAEK